MPVKSSLHRLSEREALFLPGSATFDPPGLRRSVTDLDIVIPVYDGERILAASVRRLHSFLSEEFPFSWRVIIADNASTDRTPVIAAHLSDELPTVRILHLEAKGRGRALRAAWSASDARVVCYMDADLSTGLNGLLPLVAPLLSGHSDLAVGTRLAWGARLIRGTKREFISRSYNRLLHLALRAKFSDAQCGFKALRGDIAGELLFAIRDEAWFFDTELLILAPRRRLVSTSFPSTGSKVQSRAWTSWQPRWPTCEASRGRQSPRPLLASLPSGSSRRSRMRSCSWR
jgi:glycosyltransferase involved in cell wall biosynthesis